MKLRLIEAALIGAAAVLVMLGLGLLANDLLFWPGPNYVQMLAGGSAPSTESEIGEAAPPPAKTADPPPALIEAAPAPSVTAAPTAPVPAPAPVEKPATPAALEAAPAPTPAALEAAPAPTPAVAAPDAKAIAAIERGIDLLEKQRAERKAKVDDYRAQITKATTEKAYPPDAALKRFTYLQWLQDLRATAVRKQESTVQIDQKIVEFNAKVAELSQRRDHELGVIESLDKRLAAERARLAK